MKITYITSIDPEEIGAPANHVIGSITALSDEHEVFLLHARHNFFSGRRSTTSYRADSIYFPRLNGGWRYFEYMISRRIPTLNNLSDGVIYLRISPSAKIAKALHLSNCFKVIEINGLEVIEHPSFEKTLLSVDMILVGTYAMKQNVIGRYPSFQKKLAVHSNVGIDLGLFSLGDQDDAREMLRIDSKEEVILHISGFQSHHDFECIFEAFALLTTQRARLRLLLVGEGPRSREVEEMIERSTIKNNVTFVGSVPVEKLAHYITCADVCVNSLTEDKLLECGNLNAQKTYEYIACERPVVESCNMHMEIPAWAKRNIVCVKAGDPAAFFDGLNLALDNIDYWNERAKILRDELIVPLSWKSVTENTVELIKARLAPDRPDLHA